MNEGVVRAKFPAENLNVERIEGLVLQELRLSFMGRVLWEVDDHFELLIREEERVVKELDSRDGVYKETPCPVTQYIEVLVARPPIEPTPPCEFGKLVSQEQSDVIIDQRGVDIVQNEEIGRIHEEGETESGLDPRLGSARDEKLDSWNPFDEPAQHGEDRRRRFLVLALVQGINHYDR